MTIYYNLQLSNGRSIALDRDSYQSFLENSSKSFVVTKYGEVINPSFVVGIFVDTEASKTEQLEALAKLPSGIFDEATLAKIQRITEKSEATAKDVYFLDKILSAKNLIA